MTAARTAPPRWPYPRVLAHRGGGTLAPENTLAAMRVGHARRYRGVEFDVMLAGDDVPILMHDATLGRTIAGVGDIAATPSSTLVGLDAGAWHSVCFMGEPVPRFADTVALCQALGLWMNIEIKPSSEAVARQTGEIVGRLISTHFAAALAQSAGGLDPALPEFSSFSMKALEGARATAPGIPRGLLVTAIPDDWRERVAAVGALALHPRQRELTRAQVEAVHAAGLPLMTYTVNDPERARELFDWGVDALCTDRLDLIDPDMT